jgi:hypothetical protein
MFLNAIWESVTFAYQYPYQSKVSTHGKPTVGVSNQYMSHGRQPSIEKRTGGELGKGEKDLRLPKLAQPGLPLQSIDEFAALAVVRVRGNGLPEIGDLAQVVSWEKLPQLTLVHNFSKRIRKLASQSVER